MVEEEFGAIRRKERKCEVKKNESSVPRRFKGLTEHPSDTVGGNPIMAEALNR